MEITLAEKRDDSLIRELTALWRASVEATHDFLGPADVERIAEYVPDALREVPLLAVARDASGGALGFAGADGRRLEMLFVASEARGRGVGTALLAHAVLTWGTRLVDVNEQNPAARSFYEHRGFRVIDRSELDAQGDPYPLLHLELVDDTLCGSKGKDEKDGTPRNAANAAKSASGTGAGAGEGTSDRGGSAASAGADADEDVSDAGAKEGAPWPCALETERLILRPWRHSDAADLFRVARDPRVGPIAGWPPHASVEESLEVIRTVFSAPETFAVTLREDGCAIGCIGLLFGDAGTEPLSADEAEVGYWIGVPWQGRGLIPEAVRAVERRAFESLGVSALWCSYDTGNQPSRRVAEKCGFVPHHVTEGIPNDLMGGVRDVCFTRLDREDWHATQATEKS